jgi:hypothetical protein
MSEWLQNFAYKVEISWWMFVIPGLLVLLIALLSMMGQTLKAAHTNPVGANQRRHKLAKVATIRPPGNRFRIRTLFGQWRFWTRRDGS